MMVDPTDLIREYSRRLDKEVRDFQNNEEYSSSYLEFKESFVPHLSGYEKMCKSLGSIVKLKPSKKDEERIGRYIEVAHLNITPSEAISFAFMIFFIVFFIGFVFLIAYWQLVSNGAFDSFPIGFLFLLLIFSLFLFYFFYNYPERLALSWRLKASSQMVPAILYIVIYMKHTSNFEKAVAFAAEHLDPPLSLDFKKIFWDVEIGKYSTIKESVDNYLEFWRGYSLEFIEAFQLVESSLYEPSEDRRVAFLERALQVVLDGIYDKMLKYTHEVKSPLTNVYMLGIILPTLALAILPLASAMLQGMIKWTHIFIIFNLIVPFIVIYLTWNVVSLRPGGYGDSSFLEKNPLYYRYIDKSSYFKAFLIVFPFFLIGFFPLFLTYTPLYEWIGLESRDLKWSSLGINLFGNTGVFGIVEEKGVVKGPMSFVSVILSLFIPLSIALFFIIAFKIRTKELIKEREKYKEVEEGFTSSLFQLGNRLGDGTPAEIAFAKVAETSRGSAAEGFFRQVNQNIQQLGMSVNEAIFNPEVGAIIFYPSSLIVISMKILIESVRKGLIIAAKSLLSISEYLKNMKKVDERMKDLLADIISDMKSNMVFLAPMLSGIIIGLATMITSILFGLKYFTSQFNAGTESLGGTLGGIMKIFDPSEMVSPYFLQIIVGLYLIEVVFILTSTLVEIRFGKDDLEKTYETALNLEKAIIFYFFIALISIVALSLLGAVVLKGLAV